MEKPRSSDPDERGFARYAWPFAYKIRCERYGSGTRDLIRSGGRAANFRLAIRSKATSLPCGYQELKQT